MNATLLRRLSAALVVILSASVAGRAAEPGKAAERPVTLAASVKGPTLAGLPLQLELTITNSGNTPLGYRIGMGQTYPSGGLFAVTVTNEKGESQAMTLQNGWTSGGGSGSTGFIAASLTFPVACDPLPPGTYTLVVGGSSQWSIAPPAAKSKPIRVTVKDDLTAREAAEKDLMARAPSDRFARYVVEGYSIDPVVRTWLGHLLDDDVKSAAEYAGRLAVRVRRLPPGGAAIVYQAAKRHVDPQSGDKNQSFLNSVLRLAQTVHSEETLDTVVLIARSDVARSLRGQAISFLAAFPQKKAEDALLDLAADKNSPVCLAAVGGLAVRHNAAALGPLLEAAKDPAHRAFAMQALGNFRDNPAARESLNAGLNDPNELVRSRAKEALDQKQP